MKANKNASPKTDVPKIEKNRISRINPRTLDRKVAPPTKYTFPRIFTLNALIPRVKFYNQFIEKWIVKDVLPLQLGLHDSVLGQGQSLG